MESRYGILGTPYVSEHLSVRFVSEMSFHKSEFDNKGCVKDEEKVSDLHLKTSFARCEFETKVQKASIRCQICNQSFI